MPRKEGKRGRGRRPATPKQTGADHAGSSEVALHEPSPRWESLPVLGIVLDLLSSKDLAAAASVCRFWRDEAAGEERWRAHWQREVSDQGLWRWARAEGGHRAQMRARGLVRRGDCVASTFPFNRRDGLVSEVLLLDRLPEPLVVTVQQRRLHVSSVRLQGATVKVWTAGALGAQRPLMVVYDVVKHLQLEDGRLFMWRIAGDAVIAVRSTDEQDEAQVARCRRWTEHPALTAAVLDPAALSLRDVPLDSAFGAGTAPHEWMDFATGVVACAHADVAVAVAVAVGEVAVRLFDLDSGREMRSSRAALPAEGGPGLPEGATLMLLSRNSDAARRMVVAAALFDSRVFVWRLRSEWIDPGWCAAAAALRGELEALQARAAEGRAAAAAARAIVAAVPEALRRETAAAMAELEAREAAMEAAMASFEAKQAALGAPLPWAPGEGEFVLHHAFTVPELEPIVDLSTSTTAGRIYVCGMENLFILAADGAPLLSCSMLQWRGVAARFPGALGGPVDVGAFSWPMPNSSKAAFYLDATNALFLADFRPPELQEIWEWANPQANAGVAGRYPAIDHHMAWSLEGGAPDTAIFVQSHTDLRPPPRTSLPHHLAARAHRAPDIEQVIVEYIQSGESLFAGADASCAAVASLLRAERAAGTYLPGLGPRGAARRGAGGGPAVSVPGRGGGAGVPLAPRALVLIDAATGRRYKAIPVEGALEAVHSGGHYLALAVAPLDAGAAEAAGALVVLDFSMHGFGLTPAQREEQAAARAGRAAPSRGGRGGRGKGQRR